MFSNTGNDTKEHKKIFSVLDIATIGVMAALLEVVKVALQAVPNVELVTLFIIVFTLYLGPKSLIAVWGFVGMECAVYGLGLWTVMYVYVWPILVLITCLLGKHRSSQWPFVVLASMFGLFFGAMCSIPYFFMGGYATALAWWVAGIPFDILHGVTNFIGAAVLFTPLMKALDRIRRLQPLS
ncbi:MAG: hypothetical protein K5673_00395 [Lachnospiraceae bacterium]|nr:hypothetical protein [Lachnospiraceae bacterium]